MKTNTVIGDPIDHSLSPIIHTTAYKSLGIDDEFVFNAVCVPANELEKYMKQVKEQPINGLAVRRRTAEQHAERRPEHESHACNVAVRRPFPRAARA